MPANAPGTHAVPQPPSAPLPAVGSIVEAQVVTVEGDRCFVRLPGGFEGRLVLRESRAHLSGVPLDTLPAYAIGQTLKVFIARRDRARPVFFVHERWAHNNPWPGLADVLGSGDRVTGFVTDKVPGLHGLGYLVQLDATAPVCNADGQPYEWADGQREGLVLQPDIVVLVRAEELPGANGSTAAPTVDAQGRDDRFKLEAGDPVTVLMLDVGLRPPNSPTASVLALLHHQDVVQAQAAHGSAQRSVPDVTVLRMSRAVHRLQLDRRHRAYGQALAGKHILILDDAPHARDTMATVLRNYGARVTLLLPPDGQTSWAPAALAHDLLLVFKQPFDLLLVDDGLPAAHEGERGLRDALAQWHGGAEAVVPAGLRRVVLISANTDATEVEHSKLQALGIWGALRRPLSVDTVCDLLTSDAPARWEWAPPGTAVFDAAGLPTHPAQDLRLLMRLARQQMQQDYAVLLSVSASGDLDWVAADGKPPFHARDLDKLAHSTRLSELIQGLRTELLLHQGTASIGISRPTHAHVAHWAGVGGARGRPIYLVGVGSDQGVDCAAAWPMFRLATQAKLESLQWHGALHRHASALAAGWMAQGHAHETYTSLEALQIYAQQLEDAVRRGRAAGGHVPVASLTTITEGVTWETDSLLATAHRLLRRQRNRSQPVHLPSWVEQLHAAMRRQCAEAHVALHWAAPPDLTLALPEMVLSIAVSNLVFNATKHHYRQDNRWVAVQLWQRTSDGALVCEVRDNGPGLGKDVLAHLFEPGISHAHDPAKRHGIGLWLSRTLLAQEGGSLTLYSQQRCLGSCFRLVVPVLTEAGGQA